MKKFTKVVLIIFCITCGLGLVLLAIASVNGGFRQCLKWAADGELSFGSHSYFFHEIDVNSAYDTVDGYGSDTITEDGSNITEMVLSVSDGTLTLLPSTDNSISIEYENTEHLQYYIEDNELYVVEKTDKDWVYDNKKIYVYVPEILILTDVVISVGGGELNTGVINSNSVTISLGAGEINIDELYTNDLTIEIGAGKVSIDSGEIKDASLNVGMGMIDVSASVSGDIAADCAMGSIELKIHGSQEDHNYDMNCSAGSIVAGSYTCSGVAVDKKINNGSNSDYVLKCSMGSINVTFHK